MWAIRNVLWGSALIGVITWAAYGTDNILPDRNYKSDVSYAKQTQATAAKSNK